MWITFKIYFRRIDVIGKANLQHQLPALLIANHPASFLDAMVLAVFLKRPVYFYVRGDIFKHPLVYRIFTNLHMIPIFNQGDGVANLTKNQQTFERGRVILSAGNLLLVFPEGFSRLSKQLAPFKKGAARVALQSAFEEPRAADLHVQTIAINYSSHALGANLFIRVGERLELSSYNQLYAESPAKAINKLTMDMFELFQNNVIHVRQGERTEATEEILRMFYDESNFDSLDFFQRSREACTEISMMTDEEFKNFDALVTDQKKRLHMLGLSNKVLESNLSLKKVFWGVVFMSPLSFLGIIVWWLPGQISKWIADKTVTREDFYTSVHCGVLGVFGFLWWLVLTIASMLYANLPIVMLILISPFFAFVALRWLENIDLILSVVRSKRLDSAIVEQLMTNRKKILNQ